MDPHLTIVAMLMIGFALASLLGYITQYFKLPSILGYLLAGYLIGPYSPGFVADAHLSEQLAEIGVILMLFGVGLHFKLSDLHQVKNIAIPGAIGQTLVAASVGTLVVYSAGFTLGAGVIVGLAIGVASTVVLIRILTDNELLHTHQGIISVGWLIVEDILTVAILLILPMLALFFQGQETSLFTVIGAVVLILAKFTILALVMFTWGHRVVAAILTAIARLRSHELFTLTLLALVFLIAVGSTIIFGTSIALGAFIAGMVIGQTKVRHQAAANALGIKDVFAVVFFLSVGMLFNPVVIAEHLGLFVGVLAVILIVKPLAAFLIVFAFGYSIKIAMTVAVALAQIGEFSFILAEEAIGLHLMGDTEYDILVACAIVSISLNPLLFKFFGLNKIGYSGPLQRIQASLISTPQKKLTHLFDFQKEKIVVVGFGPIGREVVSSLKMRGYSPIIIEHNIDTVSTIQNQNIIFGDASLPQILEIAKIKEANLLVITIPDAKTALEIIHSAREINPVIKIIARSRYLADLPKLEALPVVAICDEKECSKLFIRQLHRLISP